MARALISTAVMARQKRIQTAGLIRHVMSRGNGRMCIFLDDIDYRTFVQCFSEMLDDFAIECWNYCVMPNHYHATVRPTRANLSAAMQQLNGIYAQWWNRRHNTVGHVFQGRFKDQIVQRESYLSVLCRYVANNPVRAGLVKQPEDWPWSSYAATVGLQPTPEFLKPDLVLRQFGDGDRQTLQQRFAAYVCLPNDEGVRPWSDPFVGHHTRGSTPRDRLGRAGNESR